MVKIKESARFYKNARYASINLPKKLMEKLKWNNKTTLVVELDEETGQMTIQDLENYKGV